MTAPRGVEARIDWHDDHAPSGSGMCAQHTWHALGGDYGNPPAWGCSDANECVEKVKASGRYWTPSSWDGPPPRGAWVGWKYGSNGHAALSLGDGRIMTTDPSDGSWTSDEPLDYPKRWGFNTSSGDYSVWTDQYNGVRFDVEDNMGKVWTDYSGKPGGELVINAADGYVQLDADTEDPPFEGLELHALYANLELAWADPTKHGRIRIRYVREGGDTTGHQDYTVAPGAADFLLTATHWERGEKGVGGRWQLDVSGGISRATVGTRYQKAGSVEV